MPRQFEETRNGIRVRFGDPWRDAVSEEVARLGLERVAVLCSPRRTATGGAIFRALGARAGAVIPLARQHVPREVVDEAAASLDAAGADGVVSFGGGSAVGLGKALRLERDVGFVAVPTTYAGSEMTPIYGVREGGAKRVGRDPRVAPDAVVYDPEPTRALPIDVSVTSAFNAMAHAVDALYGEDAGAALTATCQDAIAAIAAAVRRLPSAPEDLDVRADALYGAYLAGSVLGTASMALHHKLAHIVGGTYDLPHAPTHTVLLPHVVAFNAPAAPEATRAIAEALGTDDPAAAIYDLAAAAGAPRRLADLGFTAASSRAAAAIAADPAAVYANPRRGTADELTALLEDARTGRRPSSS